MPQKTKNITPAKLLNELEEHYKIEKILANGVPVWPFIRNILYDYYLNTEIIKKPSTIKRSLNFLKSYNNPFKKTHSRYVLFTDFNELVKVGSKYEDKISQNLINTLNDDLLIVVNSLYSSRSLLMHNNKKYIHSSYFHFKRRQLLFKKNISMENQKILDIAIGDFKINCNYYIKLFFTYVEVFNGWLKKTKPEAVFINCYYSLFHQALIYACNNNGIKTVELQHGLISEGHTQYSPIKNIGYETFPQYLLTFGKYFSQFINNNFINSKNIFPIGHYYLEKTVKNNINVNCINTISTLKKKYKKIFLISSQKIIESELVALTIKLAEKYPEYCFVFKQRNSLNLNCDYKNIIIDSKYSIYDLMRLADVHLSCFSTTVLESIASSNAINILIDINGLASHYYQTISKYSKHVFICKNFKEITAIVETNNLEVNSNYELFYQKNNKENLVGFLNSYIHK